MIIHFYEILGNHTRFQSYLADPDVWFKEATDKSSNEYYIYILVYANGFFSIEKDTWNYMAMLEYKYTIKTFSIGEPKVYLGAHIGKGLYCDGFYACNMGSD